MKKHIINIVLLCILSLSIIVFLNACDIIGNLSEEESVKAFVISAENTQGIAIFDPVVIELKINAKNLEYYYGTDKNGRGGMRELDSPYTNLYFYYESSDVVATAKAFGGGEINRNTRKFEVSANKAGQVKVYFRFGYNEGSNGYLTDYSELSNKLVLNFCTPQITNSEEMQVIAENLNGNFELANDINLEGINWSPIGSINSPFVGVLDGKGYTIKNLSITTMAQGGTGLFAYLNGTVKNVKLEVNISASYAGGVAGVSLSNASITDCEVSGLFDRQFGEYIGGIVGKQNGGMIKNCKNNATINANKWLGGIVGWTNQALSDCVNTGPITGIEILGGIAGRGYGATNCSNNAVIFGTGDKVGGIVGESQSGTITNCTNTSEISGRNYVGGALGYGFTDISGYNNSINVTGKAYVGGVAGYCRDLSECENTGNVVANGTIVDGSNINVYFGGLAGYCVTLSNSINSSQISYSGTGNYVGGLAGYVIGEIDNCQNSAAVSSAANYVGGIAGYVYSSGSTISFVKNYAIIVGKNYVGGICGYSNGISVNGCENTDSISSSEDYVGGIIGYSLGKVDSCSNNGNVTGRYYVGGFAGRAHSVINLTNIITVSGVAYVGGIAGYIYYSAQSCENEGSIAASGSILENTTGMAYLGGIAGYIANIARNCNNKTDIAYNGTGLRIGGIGGYILSAENCNNFGSINSQSDYTGGIAGYAGSVTSCENNGGITGRNYVGGIVGRTNDHITYSYCKNFATISGINNVGGIAGHGGVGLQFNNCENSGNIIGTTYIGGICGFKASGVQENSCITSGQVNP